LERILNYKTLCTYFYEHERYYINDVGLFYGVGVKLIFDRSQCIQLGGEMHLCCTFPGINCHLVDHLKLISVLVSNDND